MSDLLFRETPCLECGQSGPHTPFSNPWYSHPNEGGSREEFTPNIEAVARLLADHRGVDWADTTYMDACRRMAEQYVTAAFTPQGDTPK